MSVHIAATELTRILASLIAWVFIARFACDPTLVANDPTYICDASNNSGWRYTCTCMPSATAAATDVDL